MSSVIQAEIVGIIELGLGSLRGFSDDSDADEIAGCRQFGS